MSLPCYVLNLLSWEVSEQKEKGNQASAQSICASSVLQGDSIGGVMAAQNHTTSHSWSPHTTIKEVQGFRQSVVTSSERGEGRVSLPMAQESARRQARGLS